MSTGYVARVVVVFWIAFPLALLVSPNAMATPSPMLALDAVVLLIIGIVLLRRKRGE